MEVVKGNMQIKKSNSGGTFAMMKRMYETQGFKGFYRGYWMVNLYRCLYDYLIFLLKFIGSRCFHSALNCMVVHIRKFPAVLSSCDLKC